MLRVALALFVATGVVFTPTVFSTDACSTVAVQTSAEVQVSDGTSFQTQSFFHSHEASAIRHIRSTGTSTIAVEGPFGWVGQGQQQELGNAFHKLFALGHQYHALLLDFDGILENTRVSDRILFQKQPYRARTGDYPYGGVVHLIHDDKRHPVAFKFEFPGRSPITTSFHDWQDVDGGSLPSHIRIDDGERIFDYRYTEIQTKAQSPLWYFGAVGPVDLDELNIYRLHRKLLVAHCLGDAGLIADSSTPATVIASRGELHQPSREDTRSLFEGVFQRLNYTEYHDLVPPIIEVSQSGDIGWISAKVQAKGMEAASERTFNDQWAWMMLVRKVDGQWLHAGNSSNRAVTD